MANAMADAPVALPEAMAAAWLEALQAQGCHVDTIAHYRARLLSFRRTVIAAHEDLAGDPVLLAAALSQWAATGAHGGSVAASTTRQRVSTIGAFYRWARSSGWISTENPAALIERR